MGIWAGWMAGGDDSLRPSERSIRRARPRAHEARKPRSSEKVPDVRHLPGRNQTATILPRTMQGGCGRDQEAPAETAEERVASRFSRATTLGELFLRNSSRSCRSHRTTASRLSES